MRCPGFQKVPAHIRKLLGPPPLLTFDSEEDYYQTMAAVAAGVKPQNDILVWFAIKDAVDARFEISLFTRVKADLIDVGEVQQRRERERAVAANTTMKEGELARQEDDEKKRALKSAKEAGKTDTEIDKILAEIGAAFDRRLEELHATQRSIIEQGSTLLVALAWKGWIFPSLKVDELLTAALRRYADAYDILERHRLRDFLWTPSASRRASRTLPRAQASVGRGQGRGRRNGRLQGSR